MNAKHTPGPWEQGSNGLKPSCIFTRGAQKLIARTTGDEYDGTDAELIVRAVNSHEELVEFVKACLDCKSADELHDFVVNNAEDVLAKAEGKS